MVRRTVVVETGIPHENVRLVVVIHIRKYEWERKNSTHATGTVSSNGLEGSVAISE
jgi:hypothetical protein